MELLTGKCKNEFEKWLIKQSYGNKLLGDVSVLIGTHSTEFKKFPFAMQYGVLVDFFDANNIYVDVRHNEVARMFMYRISTKPMSDDIFSLALYNTRAEARTEAIKKANEIFNQTQQ